jgi:pyruvate/2-oxoglutarate dehydrogenase complex dihydrolipoamide dehydrogenase (E3) component
MTHVIVIGAGPAGVLAALRAAELGARTELVTGGEFGGMAANDGPVPVRVLAHAARLIREARQLSQYGITVNTPVLDYDRLLRRVRDVVNDVRAHAALREKIDAAGVIAHEHSGAARFADPHTIETESGLRLQAEKFIICTGGTSRRLAVPGFEVTSTHSDAWKLTAVPPSMLVIGAGNTGVQVASIFHAFGTRVQLFEFGNRILSTEDEDIAAAMSTALRASGMSVHEQFGTIDSFERTRDGVRMNFSKDGRRESADAALAVVAAGWVANTAGLNLATAGVDVNPRGTIDVDEYLRTSAGHIFAAGDVTGRMMLVPAAVEDGFVAATNAVVGTTQTLAQRVTPSGSLTDPEYAQVGLTEAKARQDHEVITALVRFDATVRAVIEGQTFGFCKLIADRKTHRILGCHVVGAQAVEIAQAAAIAMTAGMRVNELARVAVSFPTCSEILVHAAAIAAVELNLPLSWQVHQLDRMIIHGVGKGGVANREG